MKHLMVLLVCVFTLLGCGLGYSQQTLGGVWLCPDPKAATEMLRQQCLEDCIQSEMDTQAMDTCSAHCYTKYGYIAFGKVIACCDEGRIAVKAFGVSPKKDLRTYLDEYAVACLRRYSSR